MLKGKVAYMSPEQAMGRPIDGRSDLFAMGIVLWELLAQQRLMTSEDAANTLHKLINEPIPRVSSVIPLVDPALDALVARALEKDRDQRWQSATQMREALEEWLAAQPRPARALDVGRAMISFFGPFREETQRQIQKHVAIISSATDTEHLQALTRGRYEETTRLAPPPIASEAWKPRQSPAMARTRASWDEYFMNIAREVATRSTCDRKYVGAVIVRDQSILATGYNGSIRGLAHCDDDGHLMEDGHCVRTVHAEANAIVQAARNGDAHRRRRRST